MKDPSSRAHWTVLAFVLMLGTALVLAVVSGETISPEVIPEQNYNISTARGTISSVYSGKRISYSQVAPQLLPDSNPWWNANWTRRRPVTINPLNPENYQIKVVLPFFDNSIRFLENKTTGELPYWVENYTADNMTVWVRRLENADNTIYVYYSNPGAASVSDGDATFVFFDDFLGTALDGTKWWSWDATVLVSDSVVTITTTAPWGGINSLTQYSLPYRFTARAQKTTTFGLGQVGLEK